MEFISSLLSLETVYRNSRRCFFVWCSIQSLYVWMKGNLCAWALTVMCVVDIGDLVCVGVWGCVTAPSNPPPSSRDPVFEVVWHSAHARLCFLRPVHWQWSSLTVCPPRHSVTLWWSEGLTQFLSRSQTAGCQWPWKKPQTHDKPQIRTSVRSQFTELSKKLKLAWNV